MTLQFGDGTYTFTSAIIISKFYGGQVNFMGKTSEGDGKYTTQSVIFNTSAQKGIVFQFMTSYITVRNIKIIHSYASAGGMALSFDRCSGLTQAYACYISNNNATSGICAYFLSVATGRFVENVCTGGAFRGLKAENVSTVITYNCESVVTKPVYGMHATYASTIVKGNATLLTGTTGDELADVGGVIR